MGAAPGPPGAWARSGVRSRAERGRSHGCPRPRPALCLASSSPDLPHLPRPPQTPIPGAAGARWGLGGGSAPREGPWGGAGGGGRGRRRRRRRRRRRGRRKPPLPAHRRGRSIPDSGDIPPSPPLPPPPAPQRPGAAAEVSGGHRPAQRAAPPSPDTPSHPSAQTPARGCGTVPAKGRFPAAPPALPVNPPLFAPLPLPLVPPSPLSSPPHFAARARCNLVGLGRGSSGNPIPGPALRAAHPLCTPSAAAALPVAVVIACRDRRASAPPVVTGWAPPGALGVTPGALAPPALTVSLGEQGQWCDLGVTGSDMGCPYPCRAGWWPGGACPPPGSGTGGVTRGDSGYPSPCHVVTLVPPQGGGTARWDP